MSFVNYRQGTNSVFGHDLAPAPVNDPALFAPTRCKVLKSFYNSGRPTQPGDVISLPLHEAMGLKAINKVLIIE